LNITSSNVLSTWRRHCKSEVRAWSFCPSTNHPPPNAVFVVRSVSPVDLPEIFVAVHDMHPPTVKRRTKNAQRHRRQLCHGRRGLVKHPNLN
jgi:hypothetical protein